MGLELANGVLLKRTPAGIPVVRVHYSADPDRDPAINPAWATTERRKYRSQSTWDREQDIVHEAGGGERLFAEAFTRYWDLIVIDPEETGFEVDPDWRGLNAFDHGKANPAAALITKIDTEGRIICTGEYYQPGWAPAQHAPMLNKLRGYCGIEDVTLPTFSGSKTIADPSIFYKNQAQSDGSFKAINDLYKEAGIRHMRPAPVTTEITGMERIQDHWMDLENRQPTLIILCPKALQHIQKPVYGVHNDGCPNLLWELRRARRVELTATRLLDENPSEKIVDKDNHLRDDLKYIVLSLPAPTVMPLERQIKDKLKSIPDPTNQAIVRMKMEADARKRRQPETMKGDWRARLEEQ